MKNTKLTLTALALASMFSLTACGGIVGGSTPQEAPKVIASDAASADASGTPVSPSPSPSATETKKPAAPPAIKGVATDGKTSFLQTTVDKTDAAYEVNLTALPDGVKKKYDNDQLQEAYSIASKFVAEEGIDSPLRSAGASENPAIFNKWVADNRDKFASGTEFTPGTESGGNTIDSTKGVRVDDKEWGITYSNDAKKPRIIEREIIQGNVSLDDQTQGVAFNFTVDYKMNAINKRGEACVLTESPTYIIKMVMENGKWKIRSSQGTFYTLKYVNADGSTTNVS